MAITVKHLKVSAIPDSGDDTLIEPSDWNADHQLVGTVPVANGGTGAATLTGYVKGNGTSAMTAASTIPNTDITGLGTASTKDAGSANGVATLDATGKVPVSELPAAVLGALSYQGTWNASTNTPTLTSSVGTKGYYYVVDVAGNTDLNGITDWLVGDWAVYNGTIWQKVDNTDAGGDVVGPASATDNAIARFDTTTGKLIQNSTVTITDNGDIANVNSVDFDITPATLPTAQGTLYWDNADSIQTLSLVMEGGNAVQQIGEETYFRIKCSAAVTEGQVVMFTGTVGSSGGLTGAPATGLTASTASYVMGVATESGALNDWIYVTAFGLVRGIDTTGGAEAWVDGQILYYDPTVTGGLTKTLPAAPNAKVQVCAVIHADANGSLFIRPAFGGALGQYEGDVQVTTPSNGQLLVRDQTSGKWVNASLTAGTAISVSNAAGSVTVTNTGVTSAVAGTGISVSGATGAVTITNSAPDQTVSLTAGTGISTSGTYPNFTITNTAPDQTVAITGAGGAVVTGTYPNFTITTPSGTVTSVTGTAPIASSGGATPAISISQATTSTDGYLSSTDWNTFNNKQPAGTYVNSVSATAPITSTGGTTPTLAMPAATGSVNGYLTSTDWNTFNSKGPAVTYTTSYVPFGQGTTTPNLSSSFTYVTGTGTLTAPAVSASNGLVVNSNTVAASYSIPSGSSAMSAGPMTVASGQTVTIPSGSRWVVL